tara:strand:- start:236 stop:1207 length:972 start_codon:yes stop_codon:yes gene_type:complete
MYCSNDDCSEYSKYKVNNEELCEKDAIEYVNASKKIQSMIKMCKIKKLLNPSNILESVYLTEDKSVIKYILKYGDGIKPKKNDVLKTHYTGNLLDGTMFDSSKKRNQEFEFILGKNQVIKMWEIGFGSMSKGEESIIIGSSEYGYGEKGSPPVIPGNSSLVFRVELIDYYEKEKEIFEMTKEEKIENMLKSKDEGKILFQDNKYEKAIEKYLKSLEYLCDEEHDEKVNILTNLSVCYGKINNWLKSLEYSEKAFNRNEKNIKVLYRIALSYFKLADYHICVDVCKVGLKFEPNNNMMNSLYRNSVLKKKEDNNKMKAMYKKMF